MRRASWHVGPDVRTQSSRERSGGLFRPSPNRPMSNPWWTLEGGAQGKQAHRHPHHGGQHRRPGLCGAQPERAEGGARPEYPFLQSRKAAGHGPHPSLTTIDVQAEAIGRRAVDQIRWRLDHPTDDIPTRILIEPKLVEGASVADLLPDATALSRPLPEKQPSPKPMTVTHPTALKSYLRTPEGSGSLCCLHRTRTSWSGP